MDIDLDTMIAAARRSADAVDNDGAATRRRVRASVERRPAARARRLTIIGAVLATMFGSTAFAYYRGPWRRAEPTPAVSPPAVPVIETVASDEQPRVRVYAVVADESPIDKVIVDPSTAPRPSNVKVGELAPVAPPPAPPSPPEAVSPDTAPDPELAAYRVAHEAHFHSSSQDALVAWDAFLAKYPSGTMAVDAKFSRALILIKLRRFADARSALQPFANAPTGSYRQAEAARLLAALPNK